MRHTLDLKAWHKRYQELPLKERMAIDTAFNAARDKLHNSVSTLPGEGEGVMAHSLPCDDNGEELVAALTAYLFSYARND